MAPDELLEQIAAILRHEIGPTVADPFAKTQAFMASVILEKLARQLRLTDDHGRADRDERATLVDDMERLVGTAPGSGVRAALTGARTGGQGEMCRLVEALYAGRDELGTERFDALLGRIRLTLRASIDRQLEYSS